MYEDFYQLMEWLETQTRLIESPELWAVDEQEMLKRFLVAAAKPLPDGSPSPFSSLTPTSAHAVLASIFVRHLGYFGQELNLLPDANLVGHLRLLGVERNPAESPILNLVVKRSREAIARRLPLEVPIHTQVRSIVDPSIFCYTLSDVTIEGSDESATVAARFAGDPRLVSKIRVGEISDAPFIPYLAQIYNDGKVISPGRPVETLIEVVERARDGLRRGNARDRENRPFGRLVTPSDYYEAARAMGSQKTLILTSSYGLPGHVAPGVTIAVWFPGVSEDSPILSEIRQQLADLSPCGHILRVRQAEIVPINGVVEVGLVRQPFGIDPNREAFNLVARAIQSGVNPPHGIWGDRGFEKTLATALEKAEGIYSVPQMSLKHSETQKPLSEIEIPPYALLEVQGSLRVVAR